MTRIPLLLVALLSLIALVLFAVHFLLGYPISVCCWVTKTVALDQKIDYPIFLYLFLTHFFVCSLLNAKHSTLLFKASRSHLWVFGIFAILATLHLRYPLVSVLGSTLLLEDGPSENATAALFFATSATFFVSAFREQVRSSRLVRCSLWLLGTMCILLAMEEISWGQRIFGWATPESFLASNYQQETNLHNLDATASSFFHIFEYIFVFLCSALCGYTLFLRNWLRKHAIHSLLPRPNYFAYAFLLPLSLAIAGEFFELITSILAFTYSLDILSELESQSPSEPLT